MCRTDHLQWLNKELAHYEGQLARAEADSLRLKPLVANLKQTIDFLASPKNNGKHASPPKRADPKKVIRFIDPARPPKNLNGKANTKISP
jgi:hypothetical protein